MIVGGEDVAQKESSAGAVAQTICVGVLKVTAKFDSVITFNPREVLGPIPGLVWPGGDWVGLDAPM